MMTAKARKKYFPCMKSNFKTLMIKIMTFIKKSRKPKTSSTHGFFGYVSGTHPWKTPGSLHTGVMTMDDTHTIWIEKYRPAVLKDIVGQDEIVERLSSYVKSGNLPHLLFTGSAGVGKTTAAVTLAKEFFKDSGR